MSSFTNVTSGELKLSPSFLSAKVSVCSFQNVLCNLSCSPLAGAYSLVHLSTTEMAREEKSISADLCGDFSD